MMYVMDGMFERGRRARIVGAIRSAPDEPAALAMVREHLEDDLSPLAGTQACDAFYRGVLANLRGTEQPKTGVPKAELLGGPRCFSDRLNLCLASVILL